MEQPLNPALLYLLLAIILLLIIAVGILLYLWKKATGARKGSSEDTQVLQMKINDLQLETLEAKLNPHLFKNILNSIQSHAYQTYFALDKLANVLDYILYESRKKMVTPKEEIEFAENLIEINKIKLSPLFGLKVTSKISENETLYTEQLLAPLISTDLIENAFRHADLQSPNAFISVFIEFDKGVFSLTVSNRISDKKALKKERSGIGATTLEQRLSIIYKDQFKLQKLVDDEIYTAHLKINLSGYKAEMLAAGR
ncbi:MAG TPA: histidine kinase [Flavobacterium sp.]|jgi:LytS/YehU family sensor histidine kinase